ncbi:MAG: Rrf2 family transcriptional regulator [Chloroflexi bacterium]|nr:Rrf2 family transcriptional regulator [Chloroflexota bacterium]
MKVSMRADYGLRALVDLAMHYGQHPVQTSEIASRQAIPEPYLDQLLTALRKAGLIQSRRGPHGGHSLVREPDRILLGEVVTALEGPCSPLDCLDKPDACLRSGVCAQREVWELVRRATQNVLDSVSIGELALRQSRLESQAVYYSI